MNAKPRIFRTYYPSTRRGYWRVSPVPKPWAYLDADTRKLWNEANKFKERLTARESERETAQRYIDTYGIGDLRI